MLIWVNKQKMRKEIKKAWTAFHNHEYDNVTARHTIQDCLLSWETFAEAMANIAWMVGIRDSTPPSEWEDC